MLPINISGLEHLFGLLVAGVSSRRPLDEAYSTFYLMLREGLTNALTNARNYEEERKRAEALAAIESSAGNEHFDIIVSDIGMPNEDGYSLMRKVRLLEDERLRRIPAVALTAFSRSEDRIKALGAGYQMHLAKPVEPDELLFVVFSLSDKHA